MDFITIFQTVEKFQTILTKIEHSISQIDRRLITIEGKVNFVEDVVRKLPIKMMQLGKGCQKAFEQTKEVINALKEHQENIGEALDTATGTLSEASVWGW